MLCDRPDARHRLPITIMRGTELRSRSPSAVPLTLWHTHTVLARRRSNRVEQGTLFPCASAWLAAYLYGRSETGSGRRCLSYRSSDTGDATSSLFFLMTTPARGRFLVLRPPGSIRIVEDRDDGAVRRFTLFVRLIEDQEGETVAAGLKDEPGPSSTGSSSPVSARPPVWPPCAHPRVDSVRPAAGKMLYDRSKIKPRPGPPRCTAGSPDPGPGGAPSPSRGSAPAAPPEQPTG